VGEAIITGLVSKCLIKRISSPAERKRILAMVEEAVDRTQFRDESTESNFKIKVDQDGKVDTIAMNNSRLRKLFRNFDGVLNAMFDNTIPSPNDATYELYNDAKLLVNMWVLVEDGLCSDVDFSDDEIHALQKQMDELGDVYIRVIGGTKVGNYMHYIIAGHMREYLLKHRNIHKYCNQNWEALNGLYKRFIGSRTQGGGHCGTKDSNKQHSLAKALLGYTHRMWAYYLDGGMGASGGLKAHLQNKHNIKH
jgi:hypothetical protein